jgi:catechol-2,3-dioxygenase
MAAFVTGVRHLKIRVTDLRCSRDRYTAVFDLQQTMELKTATAWSGVWPSKGDKLR